MNKNKPNLVQRILRSTFIMNSANVSNLNYTVEQIGLRSPINFQIIKLVNEI